MYKLKLLFVNFIEKENKNFAEKILHAPLYILSLIYGVCVYARNTLYDLKILPSIAAGASPHKAKIISIGNISWAGSGKTTLALRLYEKFSPGHKTAILRRGYGSDENELIKERGAEVFCAKNRAKLAGDLSQKREFDLFILDDGFQYRKLKKNVEIVVLGSRELGKTGLLPAYIFREPLSSLKRADFLVINYAGEIENPQGAKEYLSRRFPQAGIFLADYEFKNFLDLQNKPVGLSYFNDKRAAALAAIGYPQGFFNKLRAAGIKPAREIVYPDHYRLSEEEFLCLENKLISEGINDLIITRKDRYHLPGKPKKINVFIMEIGIRIEGEEYFIAELEKKL